MKSRSLLVCLLLAVPALAPGASKEILELQRDVAQLQQQIKDLQKSQDEKFTTLLERTQQSIDTASRASNTVAVIQSTIEKSLRDQTEKVATPVVGLSTRLNEMGGELRTLGQAVTDLTALLNRMQAQLTDINNAVKVIQQPTVAPPQQAGQPGQPIQPAAANDVAPMSAEKMYNAARQDYVSGKYDLAVQEFADYLKYYGNTDYAPNAQFYIAMVHFVQNNYAAAVKEFDMVLEKYPDNTKTPEALLYKGRALVKMVGHKTEGANEFMEVIRRFPKSDQAGQACKERRDLGLNCGAPAAPVHTPAATAKRKK
jgi:tol-pal system protein YbgF